jgi:UPF0755 protein
MEFSPNPSRRLGLLLKVSLLLSFVAVASATVVWYLLTRPNVPATLEQPFVHFPTGSTLQEIADSLDAGGFLLNKSSFLSTARRMDFQGRAGRYRIEPGLSNYRLVRLLRNAAQAPVRVTLVNERLPDQVAAKVARVLEPDSAAFMAQFSDQAFLDSFGYDSTTLMAAFIPNTYELFWTTPPRRFLQRMFQEHERFWESGNRRHQADSLGLSTVEVYTLASIVGRETNAENEKARIAGVYLNRITLGMLLQADPTLVFASRDWGSRSLAKYKDLDSPYNTYKYPGLPPGPISMASISSIDAVLQREKHDYLFFCAIGDGSGQHNFAATYDAHKRNIVTYKKNLRLRGKL